MVDKIETNSKKVDRLEMKLGTVYKNSPNSETYKIKTEKKSSLWPYVLLTGAGFAILTGVAAVKITYNIYQNFEKNTRNLKTT